MRLTERDLAEQYKAMKKETFFQNTVKELRSLYEYYLKDGAFPDEESCAAGAVAFIYSDDAHLIEVSEPDKVRIVMAAAVFLLDCGFPCSSLTKQIHADVVWIVKENMMKKFKKYYNDSDYKVMRKYVPRIKQWLEQSEN